MVPTVSSTSGGRAQTMYNLIALIGELARLHEAALVARYGKNARRLFLCARDENDRPVDPDREAKSMSSEITLDEDITNPDKLRRVPRRFWCDGQISTRYASYRACTLKNRLLPRFANRERALDLGAGAHGLVCAIDDLASVILPDMAAPSAGRIVEGYNQKLLLDQHAE